MPPGAKASEPSSPVADRWDAIVVGSGPNGLAAAIALAEAGRSVLVLEAEATIGGGTRTAELTLPGFRHDVCSAIHPLALASPFLRRCRCASTGCEFAHPRSRSPIPSTMARPRCCTARSTRRRRDSASTATPTAR